MDIATETDTVSTVTQCSQRVQIRKELRVTEGRRREWRRGQSDDDEEMFVSRIKGVRERPKKGLAHVVSFDGGWRFGVLREGFLWSRRKGDWSFVGCLIVETEVLTVGECLVVVEGGDEGRFFMVCGHGEKGFVRVSARSDDEGEFESES